MKAPKPPKGFKGPGPGSAGKPPSPRQDASKNRWLAARKRRAKHGDMGIYATPRRNQKGSGKV